MKKDRINAIADYIDHLPEERFDMREWRLKNKCGTTCCIAGHIGEYAVTAGDAKEIIGYENNTVVFTLSDRKRDVEDFARMWLGLTFAQASNLFFHPVKSSAVDNKLAARVLRKLARTGMIDWNA